MISPGFPRLLMVNFTYARHAERNWIKIVYHVGSMQPYFGGTFQPTIFKSN